MVHCPLCGLPVGAEKSPPQASQPEEVSDRDWIIRDFDRLSVRQKRKLFWEISGIILVAGILATLIVNFIVSKGITWAKYNLAASLTLFANISAFTFWRNRPFLLAAGSLAATSAFLFMLDTMSSNIGWGTQLGIPVLASFYVLLSAVIWLTGISNQWGFNILAIIFIAIGIFLICIEVFISLYFLQRILLSWSLIAGASMAIVSALMLYFHYRLKKGIELKRFFHI